MGFWRLTSTLLSSVTVTVSCPTASPAMLSMKMPTAPLRPWPRQPMPCCSLRPPSLPRPRAARVPWVPHPLLLVTARVLLLVQLPVPGSAGSVACVACLAPPPCHSCRGAHRGALCCLFREPHV